MNRRVLGWLIVAGASLPFIGCMVKTEQMPQVDISSSEAALQTVTFDASATELGCDLASAIPPRIVHVDSSVVEHATRLEAIGGPLPQELAITSDGQLIQPPGRADQKELPKYVSSEALAILQQAFSAQQVRQSVTANNLANADTVAFKRSRVLLETMAYRHRTLSGALDASGNPTAVGVFVGFGCRVSGVQTDFSQGALRQTGNELDLAIEGRGFFQATDPSGDAIYTRAGNFAVNANNQLVWGSASTGRLLEPQITIPQDATNVVVTPQGDVFVRQAGTPRLSSAGTIQLAMFVNPEGLLPLGENLYAETDASGVPIIENPGQNAAGSLRQHMLEASNVDPSSELMQWRDTERRLGVLRQLIGVDDLEVR